VYNLHETFYGCFVSGNLYEKTIVQIIACYMLRKLLFCCLLIVTAATSKAQLLTWSPEFPVETGTGDVVITCDMTKGNQGLKDYTPTSDVYVHTGVITTLSTGPSDWKYVKLGATPNLFNTPQPALQATLVSANVYRFTITGGLRNFYGLTNASEKILKISMLFRNGNGSKVQRNADGGDMYIPVYEAGLNVRLNLPPRQPLFNLVPEPINLAVGDNINIAAVSATSANLKITFNGTTVTTLTGTTITGNPAITAAGSQRIIAEAESGGNFKRDTIDFFVSPPTNVAPQPAGTKDGINYEPGDTSAILVFFAPNKTRVNVLGDFNNWTEQSNYQMNKTPDGSRFWLRITALTPGTEYGYQFLINGTLKVADYYTEKILDPNNDQFIPATTYPGLKPYPVGKTTGNVSILQTAKPVYNWQVANFAKPDKRGLVMYELLVRDFIATQNWQTLRDTLNYLKGLGINAIHVMPFNEFEGNISWGYNPSFYFAPDKIYGTETALKQFIDECHKNGIAVIMDMVLNHSCGQSPMVQMYFNAATGRPAADNPWFNQAAKHGFNVCYDMNHEAQPTKDFLRRVVQHWLVNYKIDGFRWDLSKGFTQVQTCDNNGDNCNIGSWNAYDASRVAIWKSIYDFMQTTTASSYCILEHLSDNPEEKELADYGMMFWGNMNKSFNQATKGIAATGGDTWNFEGAIHTQRTWTKPHLISYMESHDEERLMYRNIIEGNSTNPAHNVRDLNTGLKRTEMAAAFYLMIPGPKLIWQFGEMGYDFSINYCQNGTINGGCRTDPKPIRWDYLQNINRRQMRDVYAALNKLRFNPLFKDAFVSNRVGWNLSGPFKWLQVTTDTSNVCVVGNFDVQPVIGAVTFQNAGTWYSYLTGQTISATGALQSISLQPGEYYVYVNRNITNIVATPVSNISSNKNFNLSVYPNPAGQSATVEYEIPENGSVRITLLNMVGQQMGTLYSGTQPKGVYRLDMNNTPLKPGQLSNGTYMIQVEFNNKQRRVEKMLIVR
jgi:1,4-alpha-glucan branching enzyme